MHVPSWLEIVLLALAAFRTWKLIGDDTILDRPRGKALELAFRARGPKGKDYFETMIECPWCAGFWVALVWWGAYEIWPHGAVVAAVPMALSGIVGLLGHLISE